MTLDKKTFRLNSDKVWSEINPSLLGNLDGFADRAIFFEVRGTSTTLTTTEARQLATALLEQADEFDRLVEEDKPKLPAGIGAVIKQKDARYMYVRKGVNSWYGLTSGFNNLSDGIFVPGNYDVLFEGVSA